MSSAIKDDLTNWFAVVNSEDYEKYGISKGETVFIAGNGFSPTEETDMYKLLFVAVKLKDGGPVNDKAVTISRDSLDVVSEFENKKLWKTLRKKIEEDQEAEARKGQAREGEEESEVQE